jgi:potassium efflux system protein
VRGEEPIPPPSQGSTVLPTELPTSEQLQARIREVEAAKQLDEALKSKILESYRLAASQLEAAQVFASKEAAYRQAASSAPQETARIREELKQDPIPPPEERGEGVLASLKPAELEARIVQAQAELATRRGDLNDLDRAIGEQQERPPKAQAEQSAARQQLEQVDKELALAPAVGENALLVGARLAASRARKSARTLEIRSLDQEIVTHAARLELLKARRDLAARSLAPVEAGVKALQAALDAARGKEAQEAREAAEGARRDALGMPPVIQELAKETADLGTQLAQLTERTARATRQADASRDHRTRLEAEARSIREKLTSIGMTDALGHLLREQRRGLPDLRRYRRDAQERQKDLAELGLGQFRLEQKRAEAADVQAALDGLVSAAPTSEVAHAMKPVAEELLRSRAELVKKLLETFASCRKELVRLDSEEKLLAQEASAHAAYIDEQLLWVPNVSPVGPRSRAEILVALGWFVDARNWSEVWEALRHESGERPIATTLVLLGLATWILLRRRARRRDEAIAQRVDKVYTDSFSLTLEALAMSLLRAGAWSLLPWYAGVLLSQAAGASDFARAAGAGLRAASLYLLVYLWGRAILAPGGLGPAHFRWSKRVTGLLRRHITWLGLILIPCRLVISATGWDGTPAETDTLGRVAYFVSSVGLVIFAQRVLRPASGLFERLTGGRTDVWLWRLRYLWYPALVVAPLVLAGLAAWGYYFTALTLSVRVLQTIGVVVAAVVLHDLILRWFKVARARLAIAKAQEKYLASLAAQGSKMEGVMVNLETLELELEDIDVQIRKLLLACIAILFAVGCWFVWVGVLPGLRVLDQIALWSYSVTTGGQEVMRTVTVADMLLSILIAAFTVLAAKNLPALLEIAILRHLGMDAGSRFAFTTLCRYAIVGVGLLAALHFVGWTWGRVQWLVAALSLGLGFGLQEIVANLVSGIMILFERPYRVGDVVTVGDMTGIVSRIRVRATTLVDWDHREIIIPNKTFISDRLVNWTLSDPITRIVLKVGIAYGSDPARAQAVMLATARSHPLVLSDPAPGVFLVGFGQSSLDFEVRVFVKRMDDRMPAQHELNTALHKALAENGIEIPFPQLDLNVRTAPPGVSLEPPPMRPAAKTEGAT